MLLHGIVPIARHSRRIALLALLLPAACSEAPPSHADPFYLAPSREPAASSSSLAGQDMDHLRGVKQPGDSSSMQNVPATGSNPSATGLSSGNGSASFGTGSPGSGGGE